MRAEGAPNPLNHFIRETAPHAPTGTREISFSFSTQYIKKAARGREKNLESVENRCCTKYFERDIILETPLEMKERGGWLGERSENCGRREVGKKGGLPGVNSKSFQTRSYGETRGMDLVGLYQYCSQGGWGGGGLCVWGGGVWGGWVGVGWGKERNDRDRRSRVGTIKLGAGKRMTVIKT